MRKPPDDAAGGALCSYPEAPREPERPAATAAHSDEPQEPEGSDSSSIPKSPHPAPASPVSTQPGALAPLSTSPSARAARTQPQSHTLALACLASGVAASALMQTLLANATPRIVSELAHPEWYGLVTGSYLLASTLALPVCAFCADALGPRRITAVGCAGFASATLGLALAPTMPALLAARVLQGLAAGAIAPAGLAALGLLYEGRARARALSRIAVIQVLANVVGPPLGGWFTDGPGWRLGVLTVLPPVMVSLLLVPRLPTTPDAGTPSPAASPPGSGPATPSPVAPDPTTSAPETPGRWRTGRGRRLKLRREPRPDLQPALGLQPTPKPRPAPPLHPSPWPQGPMRRTALLSVLVGAVSLGALTYAPLALQTLHGLNATTTGALLIPMLVGTGAGTALTGHLAARPWTRPACWAAMLLGLPLALSPHLIVTALGLAVVGAGAGLALPLLLLDAQDSAPPDRLARAGAAVQLGRNLGSAVGVLGLGLWTASRLPPATAILGIFLTMSAAAAWGLAASHRRKDPA